ncbi:hypothetical protein IBA8403_25900 [Pseudomonas syringae]
MQFVTLCVTQLFCGFSDFSIWLKSPFRPSAITLRGQSKQTPKLRFRPDFVGFLFPVTDVALCVVCAITLEKHFRQFG